MTTQPYQQGKNVGQYHVDWYTKQFLFQQSVYKVDTHYFMIIKAYLIAK